MSYAGREGFMFLYEKKTERIDWKEARWQVGEN